MTLSLRQRRRNETTRDIQAATLKLAELRGLDNITTEEIAAAAGVSVRTFFNYYANKEAAAIGTPPGFRDEDLTALRTGTAPLAEDLKRFLDRHMAALAGRESALRMVRKIVSTSAKARAILNQFLIEDCDELSECLYARVKDRQIAIALAHQATNATARSVSLWEQEENLSLIAALAITWNAQITAAQLLARSSE